MGYPCRFVYIHLMPVTKKQHILISIIYVCLAVRVEGSEIYDNNEISDLFSIKNIFS